LRETAACYLQHQRHSRLMTAMNFKTAPHPQPHVQLPLTYKLQLKPMKHFSLLSTTLTPTTFFFFFPPQMLNAFSFKACQANASPICSRKKIVSSKETTKLSSFNSLHTNLQKAGRNLVVSTAKNISPFPLFSLPVELVALVLCTNQDK
jgi:hypothetical protein